LFVVFLERESEFDDRDFDDLRFDPPLLDRELDLLLLAILSPCP
jgi:hypothetical protein